MYIVLAILRTLFSPVVLSRIHMHGSHTEQLASLYDMASVPTDFGGSLSLRGALVPPAELVQLTE